MKRIAPGLLLLLILVAPAAPAAAQETAPQGTIVVTAVGVRGDQGGSVLFALFRGPQGWLKQDQAFARQVVPAQAESVQVRFASVPLDTAYAVQVFHDKNGNGKFDMRTFPFPKPKEGGGVSNNHTRMGPPRFAKARFALADSLVELRVIMRY
jgi:uncharacterized protein (DUF2141 family)